MKMVERYEAHDGSLFISEAEALEHEAFLARIKQIESMLPPLPKNDGCDFGNGGGFIQHAAETMREYKRAILLLAAKRGTGDKFEKWAKTPDEVAGMSIVGRILSEDDNRLYRLWHRVMCTDADLREWGQPFYALNPGKGKMVKVA